MLVLVSSSAITVEQNSKQRHKTKKHEKRGLDGLEYGLHEYQEQAYGTPSVPPPPVYEISAPDAGHPVPGHVPEPSPPVGHPFGEYRRCSIVSEIVKHVINLRNNIQIN